MDCREVVASPSLKIFRALEDEQCDLNGPALSRRKDEMTSRIPTQSKLSYDLLILGVIPELRVRSYSCGFYHRENVDTIVIPCVSCKLFLC